MPPVIPSNIPRYFIGQRVRSTVYFEDPNNTTPPLGPNGFTLVDPSIVHGMVHLPDGTETDHTYTGGGDTVTVRESIGKWHMDIDLTETNPALCFGLWSVRWKCPPGSTLVTATETEFWVDASSFKVP